jgi:glutamyl-tRNA(Gln) amidotransferase subunit E
MPENPEERGVKPPDELNPRREPVLDFPVRPLREMTPSDYDALGFLSGLEVHQQLETDRKLFCRCPAGRRVTQVDAEVLRHMRPTLSELGEYDPTALMEFKTRKEIVYLLERGSVCTYEMDDTPPFEMDAEAVDIALELAMLADLDLVSELHVMRKQYLDGSIPTGFQRTAMVGLTGMVPLRAPDLGVDRPLRIRQLSLEEDSCREVSDVGHRITFRTDRLGMPLTEVVTEPDLLTPQELQAGARLIAEIARTTGRIRRGPGAARQDVNVSVAGGRRVEIKGVPHHRGLPLLVHNEAFRQLALLRIRAVLRGRGDDPGVLRDPPPGEPWATSGLVIDAAGAARTTGFRPVQAALDRGETVCAVRLPGFAGVLGEHTQPGIRFVDEIADRVRVIACPVHRPFLAHSDQSETPGLDPLGPSTWRELRSALGAGPEDAVVVVWGPTADAATAAREVLIRAREALEGVPAETRQARPDGTTGFERLLPGPDRMYPDTDTPPLPIADDRVASIRARLPETPWARRVRYEALGLEPRAAQRLAAEPWAQLFDVLEPAVGDVARLLAGVLERRVPYHARRVGRGAGSSMVGAVEEVVDADRVQPLVRALERGEIRSEALALAFDDAMERPDRTVDGILSAYRPREDDAERLRDRLADVVARSAEVGTREPEAVLRWAMGEVLRGFRGRVDPVEVRGQLIQRLEAERMEATA